MSNIRGAGTADTGSIIRVDERASAGDRERVEVLTEGVGSGHVLVHATAGEIDGYILIKPRHFFGRDFVELLFVTSTHRRSGVGSGLMAFALGLARTDQVFTSTNQSNHPMRALLERDGWTLSGELQGLDAGDPEIVYFRWRTS